jgi:threonine 3-dehydrogenase
LLAILKKEAKPGAILDEVSEPVPIKNQVLVEVKATSICGTDIHIFDYNSWARSRVRLPLVMGHEFAGEVVEVGREVDSLQVGDSVSGETHIPCMHCEQCRLGEFHICENLRLRGVDVDGCFAKYVALDEFTAWRNEKSIPYDVASAQEPLGNAIHAVFEGGGVEGKSVAIFGCGPIGIASVGVCRASGAEKVFAVDISPYRLKLAKGFGADETINPRELDPVREILSGTSGRGVDLFLEMAGVQDTVTWGLKVLKRGGRASFLGLQDSPVTVDLSGEVITKGVTLRGIFGRRMFSTWMTVSSYLKSGKIDLGRLITHRFPLREFREAFDLMKSGQSGKVVMHP